MPTARGDVARDYEIGFQYLTYRFERAKRRQAEFFPNKVAAYVAAGRPILFQGPEYAGIAGAVHKYSVRLCVHSLSEAGIVASLEKMLTDCPLRDLFSRAALAAFHAEFNAEIMVRNFAELIGVDLEALPDRAEQRPVGA